MRLLSFLHIPKLLLFDVFLTLAACIPSQQRTAHCSRKYKNVTQGVLQGTGVSKKL